MVFIFYEEVILPFGDLMKAKFFFSNSVMILFLDRILFPIYYFFIFQLQLTFNIILMSSRCTV